MTGLQLLLAIGSALPIHFVLGFSSEKFPEREIDGHLFPTDLRLPRFRRTYKNSNEFRYRKNNNYANYFSHEVERTPMDFTGHDPLRFHVEANYDDPLWPNTVGMFLNSNRGNRRWHSRRIGFRRRISREAEHQAIKYRQSRTKMFPMKRLKYVTDNERMEIKYEGKTQDLPRKNFYMNKQKGIHYKNMNKNNYFQNDVAASYKYEGRYQPKESQEHSGNKSNKIHSKKQQRWFVPTKLSRPPHEDDIEEDYSQQALLAFMNRHKLTGSTSWRKDSDPHQGLKSVKIVRPVGNIKRL